MTCHDAVLDEGVHFPSIFAGQVWFQFKVGDFAGKARRVGRCVKPLNWCDATFALEHALPCAFDTGRKRAQHSHSGNHDSTLGHFSSLNR